MIVFFLEICVLSLVKDGYFLGFYFCLDILATVSLILDISYINDSMLGMTNSSILDSTNPTQIVNVARASQASQSSVSALRIIRIVRLIRLVKLYQTTNNILEIRKAK